MTLTASLPRISTFPCLPERRVPTGKVDTAIIPDVVMHDWMVEAYGEEEAAKVAGLPASLIGAMYPDALKENVVSFSLIRSTPALAQVQALVDAIEVAVYTNGWHSLNALIPLGREQRISAQSTRPSIRNASMAFMTWVSGSQKAHLGFLEETMWIADESIEALEGNGEVDYGDMRNAIVALIFMLSLQYVGHKGLRDHFIPFMSPANTALTSLGLKPLQGAFPRGGLSWVTYARDAA